VPDTPDPSSYFPKPPDFSGMGDFRIPNIKNALVTNAEANYASEFHRRLVKRIADFDASLDSQHEVGIRLVSFGQTVIFHLEDLGYWNPSLITFSGKTDAGDPVELIQHVSQISILLMKLPRKDVSTPKRRIGFDPEEAGKDDDADTK